jgi:hypothetical protein
MDSNPRSPVKKLRSHQINGRAPVSPATRWTSTTRWTPAAPSIPASPVLAAVLAVADSVGGVSGRDVLLAAALGLDVSCRIAFASTLDRGCRRLSGLASADKRIPAQERRFM